MKLQTRALSEIAEQIRGVTYGKQDATKTALPGYVPVLRAGNITDNGLTFDDLVYVPSSKVSPKQRIKKDDIVIAASSGSLDVVGKAARALEDFSGGFGAFCKVLRPRSEVNAAFFSHYFKTPEYRKIISSLAAGANINNLRNGDLDDLQIPLPPLAEQKRIAAILDTADALRAKRREALAQLDTLLQSTFLTLFGDPVTNPLGWEQVELGDLIADDDRINYGVVQPGDEYPGGKPLIRVGDFVGGELDLSGIKFIDPKIDAQYERSRLLGTELLVSCVGSIGTVCRVPTEAKGHNIARAVARIPLGPKVEREFMLFCLRSAGVQNYFASETRTVSQPTLNIGLIKTATVTLPPLPLQQKFAAIVESIERQKTTQRAHLAELDALFASLQHRAFRGEL